MADTSPAIDADWNCFQQLIDERLAQDVASSEILDGDCPDRLREAMAYSLLAGGKRLRPTLVLLATEACGGDVEAALPAASALEMVHTYSLIHDDLPAMDDDDLRRGRPTNHKQFGEAMAILTGDALLTLAFELVAKQIRPPETAAACCAELASAAGAVGMVAGQVVDLDADESRQSLSTEQSLQHLESIHRRKTGRLITCGLILGARIAGAEESARNQLESYGKSVGLAFQIADDLLDVTGEEVKMGKGVQKDAEKGKLTYPSLLGVAESRRRAEELIQRAVDAVRVFGPRGQRLEALARFILERDH